MDYVVNIKPCESPKIKLDMTETMLNKDLLESWKLWRQTEGAVEVGKKFREMKTRTENIKRAPRGDKDNVFKACLGRLRENFWRNLMLEKK